MVGMLSVLLSDEIIICHPMLRMKKKDVMANKYKWDIFISHATEDKESVALPLAKELSKYPIKVWIDNQELKIGDSLMGKINDGIEKSHYGVVILSPNFFAKKWTKRELEMLFMKDEEDDVVILPVWHDVTVKEVKSYNLLLASKLGIPTSKGLDYVAAEIAHRMWPDLDLRIPAKFVRELKYVDKTVDSLLRSSNISDIITLLIPDAPRNSVEHEMARTHVWQLIAKCQPNYTRTDLPRNIAARVVNIDSIESITPFDLLGHWVTIGVLSCALGDYEMLYDSIIVVQDVACQFQKEDIWVSGAKYSFGLSVFFLMQNTGADKKPVIQKLHEYCQQLIMSSAEGSHISEEARFLSIAFHEMAYQLWECKYDDNQERQTIPHDLLYSIKELALIIDSKTDYALNISMWIQANFFDSFRTPGLFTKRPE